MKKTILFSTLLCATTAYSQGYTERIDSIIDDYAHNRKDFIYNRDGSYMCVTTYGPDSPVSSDVDEVNNKGELVRSYRYEYDQENPSVIILKERKDFTYDSEGRRLRQTNYRVGEKSTSLSLELMETYTYHDTSTKAASVVYLNYSEGVLLGKLEYECDAEGNTLQSISSKYDGSDFKVCSKRVFTYSPSGFGTSETEYYPVGDGKWEMKWKYEVNEDMSYTFTRPDQYQDDRIIAFDQTKFDRYFLCVDTITINGSAKTEREFYADGRLKQEIEYIILSDRDKLYSKSMYEYFVSDDGIDYFIETRYDYDSKKSDWCDPETHYWVPGKVVDGLAQDYDVYSGFELICHYSDNNRDTMDASIVVRNGKVQISKKTVFNYDEEGNILSTEFYTNSSADKENDDVKFALDYKRVYEYDNDVPISDVEGAKLLDYSKKILVAYNDGPNVTDPCRTTYYYTRLKDNSTAVTTVSSTTDRLQPIYNLKGQRVGRTRAGQIYIQNNKKFIVR